MKKTATILLMALLLGAAAYLAYNYASRKENRGYKEIPKGPYDDMGGDYCPRCKSEDVGHYFYGLYRPDGADSVIRDEVEAGKLIPGGCLVIPDMPQPLYRCNSCGLKWGRLR